MRFFDWLFGKKNDDGTKNPVEQVKEIEPRANSVLAEKIKEVENVVHEAKKEVDEVKFIDEVTGKEYKTESALKAGITRRLNKAKKDAAKETKSKTKKGGQKKGANRRKK